MEQTVPRKPKKAAGLVTRAAVLKSSFLVAQIFGALWLMPLLIHNLGNHNYGLWAVLSSILGLLAIADLGMSPSNQRHLAMALGKDDRGEFNAVLSSGLAFFVGVTVLVLIFVAGRIVWSGYQADDPDVFSDFNIALIIIGIQAANSFLFRPVTTALTAALRYDLLTLMQIISLVVRIALTTGFILNGYGIIALAVIGVSTQAIVQLGVTFWFIRIYPWAEFSLRLVSPEKIKSMLTFGIWIFCVNMARSANFRMPPLVIAAMLGPAVVVFFAIAARLVEYVFRFVNGIVIVLLPLMSTKHGENDTESLAYFYFTSTRICAFVSTIIAASVFIFGEAFINLWVGSDYLDAIYPLYILLGGFYIILLFQPTQFYLTAVGKHKAIGIASVIELAAALVLSYVFIKIWGLNGICAAISLPIIANRLFFEANYVCKQLNIGMARFLRNIFRVIVPTITLLFGYFLLLEMISIESDAIYLFAGGGVSTLVWGLAFFVALTRADKELLFRALKNAIPIGRKSREAG